MISRFKIAENETIINLKIRIYSINFNLAHKDTTKNFRFITIHTLIDYGRRYNVALRSFR